MPNKNVTQIRIEAEGYRGISQRDCCARCTRVVLKPYKQSRFGKVFHCPLRRGYVQAYGICQDYSPKDGKFLDPNIQKEPQNA